MENFVSPLPKIRLVNVFHEPFNNAMATARTCYSSKLIDLPTLKGEGLSEDKQAKRLALRDRIASSIYEAGHHTTLQHAHVQFTLERVSRHFLWSFLHASPFYNSEQQSQRYVHMKPNQVVIPPLEGKALEIYQNTVSLQMERYQTLTEMLTPVAGEQYYCIFPARLKKAKKYAKEIQKKAQEVARYVLPVGTFANLYHTVSLVSLLRYHHMADQLDTPTETRYVVGQMMDALRAYDPELEKVIESPLAFESMPETSWLEQGVNPLFHAHFDQSLEGRVSKLVDYKINQESVMAEAVREVLGRLPDELSDADALALVLHPAQNKILSTTLNTTTLSKLNRVMHHVNYTFRKKISHTADSQDQRHRMVPGSRPVMALHLTQTPDYTTPRLFEHSPEALKVYQDTMETTWEAMNQLTALGVPSEYVQYLMPNAVNIRFTESGDLLNLHHKLKSRLCYNAQEEIWQASLDELEQITEVNPLIGQFLLPPCGLRHMGQRTPYCPEGDRYCGVPVWRLKPETYQRII